MAEPFLRLSRDDQREVLETAMRNGFAQGIFSKRTYGSSGRSMPSSIHRRPFFFDQLMQACGDVEAQVNKTVAP